MTVENSNFSNYPAFAANFNDVLIVKFQKKGEYFVFNSKDVQTDNEGNYKIDSLETAWIQKGNADYINGWLYGAVQAACKVVSKK
jgi:Holliday junction resolvase